MIAPKETHFDIAKGQKLTTYTLPMIIWDVIDRQWIGRDITFTESWPREDVKGPTIVWSVYRRVPGKQGLETLKPRLRGSQPSSEDPNITVEQYGQWQTILYQFDIYDTTNPDTNALTEEFEELLFHITPILKDLGVSEWLFEEQTKDYELGRSSSQEIYRRTLRYRCILEKKYQKEVPNIQEIWLRTIADPITVENMALVRDANSNRDYLPNDWVSLVSLCSKSFITGDTPTVTGDYLEGVDFKLVVSINDGKSYIEWQAKAAHPQPGELFYVFYTYYNATGKNVIQPDPTTA